MAAHVITYREVRTRQQAANASLIPIDGVSCPVRVDR